MSGKGDATGAYPMKPVKYVVDTGKNVIPYVIFPDGSVLQDTYINSQGHRRRSRWLSEVMDSAGRPRVSIGGIKRYVARLVAGVFCERRPGCDYVDHINGDVCDNRCYNLRWVTQSGNARAYRSISKNARSRFRGVSPSSQKCRRPWRSGIHVEGRTIHIGVFNTEEEAAAAYNSKALEYGFHKEALNSL